MCPLGGQGAGASPFHADAGWLPEPELSARVNQCCVLAKASSILCAAIILASICPTPVLLLDPFPFSFAMPLKGFSLVRQDDDDFMRCHKTVAEAVTWQSRSNARKLLDLSNLLRGFSSK